MSTKDIGERGARSGDATEAADVATRAADVATRRRFFVGAGAAALAVPIAFGAVAMEAGAGAGPAEAARDGRSADREAIAARLAALEDANAIRELQHAYARHLDAREHAATAALFAEPRRARFDDRVRGIALEGSGAEVAIEIAADRRTAVARALCVVRIETPIEAPGCTLVDMARAQGEGVLRRSERRSLEQRFVRRDGAWKIDSADFSELA